MSYTGIEEKIRNPILTFSKSANMYYVYRHYYYNDKGKDITFYVGKGQGTRALSENNRSDLWKERVSKLKGIYFIDIVEFFDNEEDALSFEKELISYYTVNEFGCECNKISKQDMANLFLENANIKALEAMMDAGMELKIVLKAYIGMNQSLVGKSLIDIIATYMKFLKKHNSKYRILFKENSNFSDIDTYQYENITI